MGQLSCSPQQAAWRSHDLHHPGGWPRGPWHLPPGRLPVQGCRSQARAPQFLAGFLCMEGSCQTVPYSALLDLLWGHEGQPVSPPRQSHPPAVISQGGTLSKDTCLVILAALLQLNSIGNNGERRTMKPMSEQGVQMDRAEVCCVLRSTAATCRTCRTCHRWLQRSAAQRSRAQHGTAQHSAKQCSVFRHHSTHTHKVVRTP